MAHGAQCSRNLGGRTYRGTFSFWEDPTDAIAAALETAAPDSYADQLAAKQERAQDCADRHATWTEKARARSDAAYQSARDAVAGIPFSQPILIGHHSERGHRAALRRHDARMRRAIEEHNTAEYHARRVAAAAHTADPNHTPAFCQRRITDAEAEIRDCERRIARTHDPDRLDLYGSEGADGYRQRIGRVLDEAREKLAYWCAQLDAAGGCDSRATPSAQATKSARVHSDGPPSPGATRKPSHSIGQTDHSPA